MFLFFADYDQRHEYDHVHHSDLDRGRGEVGQRHFGLNGIVKYEECVGDDTLFKPRPLPKPLIMML